MDAARHVKLNHLTYVLIIVRFQRASALVTQSAVMETWLINSSCQVPCSPNNAMTRIRPVVMDVHRLAKLNLRTYARTIQHFRRVSARDTLFVVMETSYISKLEVVHYKQSNAMMPTQLVAMVVLQIASWNQCTRVLITVR